MTDILLTAGLAAAAAFAALALKKYAPEISAVLSVAAGAVILISVLHRMSPIISQITQLSDKAGLSSAYGRVLIKTIGICFLCRFTADTCRDSGQSALASKVELAGKISVLLIALPLFADILSIVSGLLNNSPQ